MKVWAAIFNLFAVLIIMLLSLAYFNTNRVLDRDFNQARLNQAVKYSTEATLANSLSIEDTDLDYTDLNNISVSPGNSLDTFETMMCFNYNLSTSDSNKEDIENSIAVAVLSTNNGYYVTQTAEVDTTPNNGVRGGEYATKWSPKIPYTTKIGSKTYAINIGSKSYMGISDAGTVDTQVTSGYPMGINSQEKALEIANQEITKSMIKAIDDKNVNNDPFNYKFFLPSETTKTGINPIKGTGILVLMQNTDFASAEKISSISVSGYKAIKKVNVVSYIENVDGILKYYYCYQGQLNPNKIKTYSGSLPASVGDINQGYAYVTNYFDNTRKAATGTEINDNLTIHYQPDFSVLTKKIATD